MTDTPKEPTNLVLTPAQEAQHQAVLTVARENLKVVTDQVASLTDESNYDAILTPLKDADTALGDRLS